MPFTRLLTFFLLLPTVFLAGCQKENAFDCLKSTGSQKTEIRRVQSFRNLRVFDNLDVTIMEDTETYVEITAGKNLLANITAEVTNGELSLRNINKCNWVRSYEKPRQIRVHVPRLKNIFHDGDGLLNSENTLPCDTLFLHVTGAGDTDFKLETHSVWLDMYELGEVRLSGENGNLSGYVLSQGSLKAEGLRNREAFVKITGLGHAFVQATDLLIAEIYGPGSVYYFGNPAKIQTSGNGPGQVLQGGN